MYSLIIEIDQYTKNEYILSQAKYLIGKHPLCNLVISDPFVSRFHCTLVLKPPDEHHDTPYYVIVDGLLLSDQKSTNGTWLNSKLVTKVTEISHQDTITFGNNRIYPRATFIVIKNQEEEKDNDTFATERK
jgi:pSer/pThr/pTyr-binding forkhead associated (FHA) protein